MSEDSTSSRNSSMETCPRRSRSARSLRPVRHVVIATMITIPTTIGNHPPFGIFARLAPKNARSIVSSGTVTATTFGTDHRQVWREYSAMRSVVIPIVAVTAIPYAAARFDEVRKASTREMLPIISNQLTIGT